MAGHLTKRERVLILERVLGLEMRRRREQGDRPFVLKAQPGYVAPLPSKPWGHNHSLLGKQKRRAARARRKKMKKHKRRGR